MSQTCLSDMSKGELGAKAVKSILNNYDCLLLAIEEICNNCTNPEMSAKGKDVIRRKVSTQIDNKSKSQFFFKNKLDEMKISVYYELLDDLLSAMESRFNQETLSLIEAIASLLHMEIKPEMIDILAKFSNTSMSPFYLWFDWLQKLTIVFLPTVVFIKPYNYLLLSQPQVVYANESFPK
ncbi:hypothetical protein QTP88_023692 [Uroleucon formosanum]